MSLARDRREAVAGCVREFQLGKPCEAAESCALSVDHVTVKNNPANELFAGTHARSAAFQSAFLDQVAALSRPNAATLGMSVKNVFDEFESVSQRADVVYRNFATSAFKTQIASRITNTALRPVNILDRAPTVRTSAMG